MSIIAKAAPLDDIYAGQERTHRKAHEGTAALRAVAVALLLLANFTILVVVDFEWDRRFPGLFSYFLGNPFKTYRWVMLICSSALCSGTLALLMRLLLVANTMFGTTRSRRVLFVAGAVMCALLSMMASGVAGAMASYLRQKGAAAIWLGKSMVVSYILADTSASLYPLCMFSKRVMLAEQDLLIRGCPVCKGAFEKDSPVVESPCEPDHAYSCKQHFTHLSCYLKQSSVRKCLVCEAPLSVWIEGLRDSVFGWINLSVLLVVYTLCVTAKKVWRSVCRRMLPATEKTTNLLVAEEP